MLKKLSQRETRSLQAFKTIFLQATLSVIFLLVPAIFLSLFLEDYREEEMQENISLAQEKARTQLAFLQKELDLNQVVASALRKFETLCNRKIAEKPLLTDTCLQLEKDFFKTFPSDSKLVWLDSRGHFIATNDRNFAGGKRIWEAIIHIIQGRGSRIQQNIADSIVKSAISQNLDQTLFNKISLTPTSIYYYSNNYLLSLLSFKNRKNEISGYLVTFLPNFNRRPDWLETRALGRLSQKGVRAGVFFTTREDSVASSSISAGQLHGFLTSFMSGKTSKISNGKVYCFSFLPKRKDCFICAAADLEQIGFLSSKGSSVLKALLFLPFFITISAVFFFACKTQRPILSIRTRFRLTTLSLSTLPAIVMIILGSINSNLIKPEINRQQIEKLRNQIDAVKEKASLNLKSMENRISRKIEERSFTEPLNLNLTEKLFKDFQKDGCHNVYVFRKDGEVFQGRNLKSSEKSSRVRMISWLLLNEFFFFGFNTEKIEEKYKINILKPKWGNLNRSQEYETFVPFELAGSKYFLFVKAIETSKKKGAAIVVVTFDKLQLSRKIFAEAFGKTQYTDTKLFQKFRDSDSGYIKPRSKEVSEILELTSFSQESFFTRFTVNNSYYLAFSKYFNDLNLAIAGVTRLNQANANLYRLFMISLVATLLLAAFMGNLALRTLKHQLLQPVENLTKAVDEFREGHLGKTVAFNNNDEISQLASSFNKMSLGLKEKAKMSRFLNKDLLENNFTSRSLQTNQIEAVVLFAGIRNFNKIESELSPEEAFTLMNSFLSICENQISKNSGKVDKFIGDTIMSFFADEEPGTALKKALDCGLAIEKAVMELQETPAMRIKFSFGIGIAVGTVISGAIGSKKNRLDFTLIGDPVNLAARLEKLAGKNLNPGLLVSCDPVLLAEAYVYEQVDIASVKGKKKSIQVFSIKGKKS